MTKERFSLNFKPLMREYLMAEVLSSEIKQVHKKFDKIAKANNATSQEVKIVGFYYLNRIHDMIGDWLPWHRRIPLHPDLYADADKVLAELAKVELNREKIGGLITNALKKSKSVADMFELLPDGYHPTMAAVIKDYIPNKSAPTLTANQIADFHLEHEPILRKFREYLMLRLITG